MTTRPISSKISKKIPTVLPRLALSALLCTGLAAGLTACTDTADSANLGTSFPATTAEEAPQLPSTMGDNGEADDAASLTAREDDLSAREADISRREDLSRREARLAAREAELARRERQARTAPAPAPRPRAEAPAPEVKQEVGPGAYYEDDDTDTRVAENDNWREEEPTIEPVTVRIPSGTAIDVEFRDGVSSATSQPGESFSTRVASDVYVGSQLAIPAGSRIEGTVTEAKSLRKVGGKARLGLSFDQLVLPSGDREAIAAGFTEEGKSETAKDAATIGGAAAGGAVIGHQTGGKKDKDRNTAIGAILGAAVGTAIAAKTEGQEVEIPAGTVVTVYLDEGATVTHR